MSELRPVIEEGTAAFQLLHALFTYPLTAETVRPLLDLESDDPRLLPTLAGFKQSLGAVADWPGFIEGLNVAYTGLFEGRGDRQVSAYGSAWIDDGRFMGPETLAVRDDYLDWLLVPTDMGKLPDDHISLELAFLAHLGKEALTSDSSHQARALGAQASFLHDHLLSWLPQFSEKVSKQDPDGFFARVASLTVALSQVYSEWLADEACVTVTPKPQIAPLSS